MIKLISPIPSSLLYTNTTFVDYEVTENSKHTSKVVFYIDNIKYEKTELKGRFETQELLEGKHKVRAYLVNRSGKIIIGSEVSVSFYTNNNVIVIKNLLSKFVPAQIPSFIREDYTQYVKFVEAYYAFLEQSNDPNLVPFSSAQFFDVDTTPTILLERFRKLFLPDFPETLAVDKETGTPLNIRNLIKRAKDFYQSKGTENSFNFVFKVLFDEEIDIFYPREQMFVVSGGNWREKKTLRFKTPDTDKARALITNIVYQKNGNDVVARARVVSVEVFMLSPYKIVEIELEEIYGTFTDTVPLECDLIYEDAQEHLSFDLKRGATSVTITNSGVNYVVGDTIRLESVGGSGVGYVGRVAEVNSIGSIIKINTVNFGFNYEADMSDYTIISTIGTGKNFAGTFSGIVLCEYTGYYTNRNGVLGEKSFIQDNHYYQSHSYEIEANIPQEKYSDSVKRLVHPAGYKMFGSLCLKQHVNFRRGDIITQQFEQIDSSVELFSSFFIGNFVAYRPNTTLNLRNPLYDLFPNGFNPNTTEGNIPDQENQEETPHDSMGDPIDLNLDVVSYYGELPTVTDIDMLTVYWVVFPHPLTILPDINHDVENELTVTNFHAGVRGSNKAAEFIDDCLLGLGSVDFIHIGDSNTGIVAEGANDISGYIDGFAYAMETISPNKMYASPLLPFGHDGTPTYGYTLSSWSVASHSGNDDSDVGTPNASIATTSGSVDFDTQISHFVSPMHVAGGPGMSAFWIDAPYNGNKWTKFAYATYISENSILKTERLLTYRVVHGTFEENTNPPHSGMIVRLQDMSGSNFTAIEQPLSFVGAEHGVAHTSVNFSADVNRTGQECAFFTAGGGVGTSNGMVYPFVLGYHSIHNNRKGWASNPMAHHGGATIKMFAATITSSTNLFLTTYLKEIILRQTQAGGFSASNAKVVVVMNGGQNGGDSTLDNDWNKFGKNACQKLSMNWVTAGGSADNIAFILMTSHQLVANDSDRDGVRVTAIAAATSVVTPGWADLHVTAVNIPLIVPWAIGATYLYGPHSGAHLLEFGYKDLSHRVLLALQTSRQYIINGGSIMSMQIGDIALQNNRTIIQESDPNAKQYTGLKIGTGSGIFPKSFRSRNH